MTDHERNFRTHFYEKVGFRTLEEKKSIEVLLSEQPIDKNKLRDFCRRHGVPALYRPFVWKVLLGVLPLHSINQDFVWTQRKEQVRELERAYILLSDTLDASVPQKMLKMKLIEEGCMPMQDKILDSEPNNQYYFSIARAVNSLVSSDVDLFWISTRFFHYISKSFYPSLHKYPEYVLQCLRQEDQDQRLYQHLSDHLVLSALPLLEWFHICFSNILPEQSLELVWDKIIGGCNAILIYVAVAILLVLKRPLMAMHTTQDMLNILKKIPEDCGDKIVNEAIELLHKYGCEVPGKYKDKGTNLPTVSEFRDRINSSTIPNRRPVFGQDSAGSKVSEFRGRINSVSIPLRRPDKMKLTGSNTSDFRDRINSASTTTNQSVQQRHAQHQEGGRFGGFGDFRDRINSANSTLQRHESLDSALPPARGGANKKRQSLDSKIVVVQATKKSSSAEKVKRQSDIVEECNSNSK